MGSYWKFEIEERCYYNFVLKDYIGGSREIGEGYCRVGWDLVVGGVGRFILGFGVGVGRRGERGEWMGFYFETGRTELR